MNAILARLNHFLPLLALVIGSDAAAERLVLEIDWAQQLPAAQNVTVVTPADEQAAAFAPASANDWWTARAAGRLGAIAGSGVGIWGAIIGCLAGFLVPRGRGRRVIMGLLVAGLFVAVPALIAGIAAALIGQPYHVYYPLLLLGGLVTLLDAIFIPVMRRRYEQVELQRMRALDATA